MKQKTILKIVVDIGMTVMSLLLMTYELIGEAAHEWFGIGMFALFIIHHILNRKWSRSVFKGKYTLLRIWQTVLVIGNHTIRVWFRDDNENDARAKNAEYRRSRISDDTFEFLLHYLAEYRKLLQRQDYLFINISGETAGQPLKAGSVYDMLGRMEKKTQIRITPHMLRRYFSVIRWNDGWPLEMISQALGHRHLDTTVKYLSVLDDRLMEASRAFYEKHSDDYGIRELL